MKNNPDPILIHSLFGIDGLNIRWYGVLLCLSIIAAILLAEHEKKRRRLPKDTVLDLSLICIPAGIICARLFYVLFCMEKFHSFKDVVNIADGGLALYGAFIGGLVGLFIYCKIKKLSPVTVLDAVIPGIALAQSIGRWGDFFNQEAFGPIVANPGHSWFPLAVKIDALNEIHYAAFFYESVWCLMIFIFLWFILRKRAKHSGDISLAYAVLYSFERMFVELLRTDSLMAGSVRISHLLSALVFVSAIIFIAVRSIREKKLGFRIWPRDDAAVNAVSKGSSEAECPESDFPLNESETL